MNTNRKFYKELSALAVPFALQGLLNALVGASDALMLGRLTQQSIAAAGMAAHLAGAIAANTTLPVIGIPCKGACLDGIDALLSTVMMPSGIPVATVAINGGVNAALLCAQIIAVEDAALAARLDAKRAADAAKVLEKDAALTAELNR